MIKTPFSAKISVKCSFVKRFGEASQLSDVGNLIEAKVCQPDNKKFKELEEKNLKLQDEIKRLTTALKNDQNKPIEELIRIQKLQADETERVKASEVTITEFREEVLKVKKEKNEVNKMLKLANESLESVQMKYRNLDTAVANQIQLMLILNSLSRYFISVYFSV